MNPQSPPSTGPTPTQSVVVRFLDAFLQERNIKWLLAVGMMIMLGSSLLLVTPNWEQYAPWGQNLIVLLYALAIHGAGQWTYHRLGLRKTGIVLQGLTVLLIPILFLAFRWDDSGILVSLESIAMFAATAAFAALAAKRVLDFFLRGRQTTFLAAYTILAVSGSFLKDLSPAAAPLALGLLWTSFAVGAVKVSRHIFWLTEEHRAPRVVGFFPIALLGSQFLLLYGLNPSLYLDLDWIGLGLVLTAVPILATADSVARVFQQRTGDLVRPLPWAIIAPVVVGLLLTAAGVVLAATGVGVESGVRPMLTGGKSLTLAAFAAAGLMAMTARRTGKEAFAWAMLAGVLVAYQFSPMLVREAVLHLRSQVEASLNQGQPLPFAFYGFTYLPLLLGAIAVARSTGAPFARPARLFACGLTCLLWALSLTHSQAIFAVGLTLTAAAAMQAVLLRSWPAVLIGLAAWVSASVGAPYLFGPVGDRFAMAAVTRLSLVAAAAALLVFGRWMDRRITPLFPNRFLPLTIDLCRNVSLMVGLAAAFWWWGAFDTLSGLAIAALLAIHAGRCLSPWISGIAIVFAQLVAGSIILGPGVSDEEALLAATVLLTVQWLASVLLERVVAPATRDGLVRVSSRLATAWLLLLSVGYLLPSTIFVCAGVPVHVYAAWTARALATAWAIALAARSRNSLATIFAYAAVMLEAGAAWVSFTELDAWLPAVWAAMALTITAANEWTTADINPFRATLRAVSAVVLGVLTASGLVYLNGPLQVAGLTALAGLAIIVERNRTGPFRFPLAVLVNLQALVGVAALASQTGGWIVDSLNEQTIAPLAAAAGLSLVVWQIFSPYALSRQGDDAGESAAFVVDQSFRWMLRAVVFIGVCVTADRPYSSRSLLLIAAALGLTALSEFLAAVRNRSELRVWSGKTLSVLGLACVVWAGVPINTVAAMFVALGFALGLHAARHWARGTVFDRPLAITSFALPLAAVAIGVFRQMTAPVEWSGVNCQALLLAAGFYFWRGIELCRKEMHLLALAILNIAIALMWAELSLWQPQCFLIPIGLTVLGIVELLRREIPQRFHNTLRYAGALAILVSPVFNMFEASWLPYFTLMVASVVVILLAIGLRLRVLLYTGTAFLVADLTAIVVKAGIENPNILWLAGIGFGASVIALGAYCERHRERLLSRMNVLASSLRTWS